MTGPPPGEREPGVPWGFAAIWLTQLLSVVGSALTAFVLGVEIYRRTGSVTLFALIALSAVLPGILVSPLAGVVTDRWDRRRIMVVGDCGAALATGAIALLVAADRLEVWHVYLATAAGAVFGTFHQLAYSAMVPTLVGARRLARVNGLTQVAQAVQIAAPLVAGALLGLIGLAGMIVADLTTFALALGTLLAVRLPAGAVRPARTGPAGSLRADIAVGLRYLGARPALLSLVVVFGLYNFLFGLAAVLVQPLILSFSGPATLGALMFAGGSGLFLGSVLMATWGGPRRRVDGIFLGLVLGGVFLVMHSLRPSAWLIAVAAPAFLFTLPLLNSTCLTLVQTKTDPAVLGRVLAAVRMVAQSAMPVAYLIAGPLADGVAEPLLRADGPLAGTVGRLIGTGDGRGIALVFLVDGLLMASLAAAAYARPRLRLIDDEPDLLAEPALATADGGRTGESRA